MNISCHHCGELLAIREGDTISVKGQQLPVAGLAAVILKCEYCQRTRTWHFKNATISGTENGCKRNQKYGTT